MPEDFSYYLFVGELPQVRAATYELEQTYRATGNVPAAEAVKRAYERHIAQLELLAFDVSAQGTEILRARERTTRVRPDTGGGGGPRLGDNLFCDPLSAEGLPGSVGVNNMSILDANVPWWSTNEEGSSARVNAKLYGAFEPGGWIPDSAYSGQHPIFEPLSSTSGEGGWMTIRKPIPARRFVESSIPEIRQLWRTGFDSLKAQLVAEVLAAGRL